MFSMTVLLKERMKCHAAILCEDRPHVFHDSTAAGKYEVSRSSLMRERPHFFHDSIATGMYEVSCSCFMRRQATCLPRLYCCRGV